MFAYHFYFENYIGNATKAPCKPNFIFVVQRENTRERDDEDDEPGTTKAPPEEPKCGSSKVHPRDFNFVNLQHIC